MARHYVGGDRDQLFLLATSMRDWLDEGHLAWFMIDVVAKVDTTAFHAIHPNDGPGRPAYHPDMMLAMLFYAYGTGIRSSRRIEAACRSDAAFRVICGNVTPDHATIARFLVDHEAAIEASFVDVLRLCAAAGLVSVGTIAIDGTKIAEPGSGVDPCRGGPHLRRGALHRRRRGQRRRPVRSRRAPRGPVHPQRAPGPTRCCPGAHRSRGRSREGRSRRPGRQGP